MKSSAGEAKGERHRAKVGRFANTLSRFAFSLLCKPPIFPTRAARKWLTKAVNHFGIRLKSEGERLLFPAPFACRLTAVFTFAQKKAVFF
jgi:hypothetical protein